MKRALISVSDKTGIVSFAKELKKLKIEILSTGGTAKVLRKAGIKITDVSQVTGFPEMMDGRIKTLHPKIHGALLGLRDNPQHITEANREGIEFIDMVVVNLYPFETVISQTGCKLDDAIENIDIGGPTLLRSAAKNYKDVTVICEPADYAEVLKALKSTGSIPDSIRQKLAVKAFRHTANYDSIIDMYLSKTMLNEEVLHMNFNDGVVLRYGENWHQEALFYPEAGVKGPTLSKAKKLHGKTLSYNNYVDADNALQTVKEIGNKHPVVAIVKHNNPCGLATGKTLCEALQYAWDGDPVSAFGSIICTNTVFDLKAARFLKDKFVEIILAPKFKPDALEYLKNKSKDIRILELPQFNEDFDIKHTYKYVIGGMLKQTRNIGLYEKWDCVTKTPYPQSKQGLSEFCICACKSTKSNSVTLAYEYRKGYYTMIAMGAGQPNRVDSIRKLVITKAKENLQIIYEREGHRMDFDDYWQSVLSESVMSSDAFFPFDDSIIHACENKIRYIVSPGGSIRDNDVIATANRLGVAMIFTGMRHFLH